MLGLLAGYYRGLTGTVILRLTDLLLALPGILLALTIVAATGPSLENLIVAVGDLLRCPAYVRVVNGAVPGRDDADLHRGEPRVGARQTCGFSAATWCPNILAPVIVLQHARARQRPPRRRHPRASSASAPSRPRPSGARC